MNNIKAIIPFDLNIPLANGVWTITPTLISSEEGNLLVDTGMPGMTQEMVSQMQAAGFSIDQLTGIVLTHQDIDHIGNVSQMLELKPGIAVYAHAADKPYIEGKLPLIKEPHKMLEAFGTYEAASSDIVTDIVSDGEQLDFAEGIVVIHTPGHTPGHISLYDRATKTLIAGDAMVVRGDQLLGPNPMQTTDLDEAYQSLAKLAAYDIEKIICFHGGVYDLNVNERIAAIAAAGPSV
ncbi:hypothetical protein BBD42_05260 [Paenibacillus sp. BIHB 4019]|uniref:Metallo-beta-lactamase domain-containing protein n=1 Tax=Paenibacillus sp. BIHB 4019 TaxID=1870819 RepID=A0A1B2DDZ1_9BACL|nr:MBL fold metallo-hydrolase [Paenibacillus sp. BIHB 4019]ANY65938.1 hypothetical protein BBD42_05260 [Paenibacillus sp. BIHB 4019]